MPGGCSPFIGPPQLLDRVSSRDSPVNSEDNLSSNKDEEDPTGEVAEVVPTGMNPRLEDLPLPLVNETLRVGDRLTSLVQQGQNLVSQLPCILHTWERSAVGVGISTSTHQNTHPIQHREYAQGLADGSGLALVQRGNKASVPFRNQGFLQPSLPGAEKDRGFTSCHRSFPLEQPSGYSAVQDGDPGN